MTNTLYNWSTTKIDTGFKFKIVKMITRKTPNENGSYVDTEIIKEGIAKTRALATSQAKKWKMHFKRGGKA